MALAKTATSSLLDLDAWDVDPAAASHVPSALAFQHDVLALETDGNVLTVALPEGADPEVIDRVRLATGMHVRAFAASREAIRLRLRESPPTPETGDEVPAVRTLHELQERAVVTAASDIHFEPGPDAVSIRFRVDGLLREASTISAELYAPVASRVKLLAGMNIADRRQPQDGQYRFSVADRSIDARVSSMPTLHGEKLVVRLFDCMARPPVLTSLGMPPAVLDGFRNELLAPFGMLLVAGPTGSGKTTTLYASLASLDARRQNVCSVEDPVEIRVPGITQVQVHARAGLSFEVVLRSLLRQDPNVVMIGEMRDPQTATLGISAALSGQLVLTTLHANDAARTFERLLELGAARYSLAAALNAIVCQRLVRALCRHCRVPARIPAWAVAAFALGDDACFGPSGCARCAMSGYSGRTGIFELLAVTSDVREAVSSGACAAELSARARKNGYRPMAFDALDKVCAGVTSFEEATRLVSFERLR